MYIFPSPPQMAHCHGPTHRQRCPEVYDGRISDVEPVAGVQTLECHDRDGGQDHAEGDAVQRPHQEEGHLGAAVQVEGAVPRGEGQEGEVEEDLSEGEKKSYRER